MVSVHTTRHCILHKRTSTRPHSTTELSQKRVKHLLRYLHGTKHYKFTIEPTTTLRANTNNILDLDVYVDADWAGCPTTRKSTSGFNIIFLGTTVAFGSRTQATIALSSADSELYAICTGVNEGLHLRNFLLETNICSKLNLRIRTGSTAGKSIATHQALIFYCWFVVRNSWSVH